jgi:hypothetical protein
VPVPAWDLADRLRKTLRESGVGVQEMADYLEVSRNTVSAWIRPILFEAMERAIRNVTHPTLHINCALCLQCAYHCAMLSHMPKGTEFVGSAETCRILEIHPATLLRWVADEKISPAHKLPGKNGAYLFKRADVDQLAAERAEGQRVTATAAGDLSLLPRGAE